MAKAQALAAEAVCEGPGARPCHACAHCRKAEKGIHPDIAVIDRIVNKKTGKLNRDIIVDQIRDIGADAVVLPNEARTKVYIFPQADLMNPPAQNAFLKLLEEPPRWVIFLLCTENRSRLLETIRSRCGELRVGGKAEDVTDEDRERADGFLDVRADRPELWRWCVNAEKLEAPRLKELIDTIRLRAPQKIADVRELMALEEFLDRALAYLRANVGVKTVTGYLSTYVYSRK